MPLIQWILENLDATAPPTSLLREVVPGDVIKIVFRKPYGLRVTSGSRGLFDLSPVTPQSAASLYRDHAYAVVQANDGAAQVLALSIADLRTVNVVGRAQTFYALSLDYAKIRTCQLFTSVPVLAPQVLVVYLTQRARSNRDEVSTVKVSNISLQIE